MILCSAAAVHARRQLHDDDADGPASVRTTSSTGPRRVGEALDLPINEPPPPWRRRDPFTSTYAGAEDGAAEESTSSSSALLHLTEDNFVATFQSMFDIDESASKGGEAEGTAKATGTEAVETDTTAVDDVVLCLFVVYSPECEYCRPILLGLEEVSKSIDEEYGSTIASQWESTFSNTTSLPPRPIIAKLDGSAMTRHFFDKLQPLTGYPTLKVALARRNDDTTGKIRPENIDRYDTAYQQNESLNESRNDGDDDGDSNSNSPSPSAILIDIFDFIGHNSTEVGETDGIAESIWHYWYRFVVVGRMAMLLESAMQQQQPLPPQKISTQEGTTSGEHPPVFIVESESTAVSFLYEHGRHILKPVKSHAPIHLSDDEAKYVQSLLQPTSVEEEAGLGEPVTIFVQCRHQRERNGIYAKFDALAGELVNRRDAAFFAIQPDPNQNCGGPLAWFEGEDKNGYLDGSIRVIKQSRYGTRIQREDAHAFYSPFSKNEAARDNMTQFVIIHSTPTLLWFDRNIVADYAFPIYRTVHAVLFIDTPEFGNDNGISGRQKLESNSITKQSRYAIGLFRKAAIGHRRSRPSRDIVFLIVPSYEIRVFNIFGIDIWSSLDRQFASARGINSRNNEEIEQREQACIAKDKVVPTVMLTSRTNPKSGGRVATRRYYLPADDILFGDGDKGVREGDDSSSNNNVISRFIKDYFDGALKPSLQSQPTPLNRTNAYNVQLLTGNTFKPLVLDREGKHTLINFFAPTCGHSKRFDVVWNELGHLVRALRWDGVIDVMKMDLTKNELPLDDLRVWEYPSVFYFPAGSKTKPVPMKVESDAMYGDANLRGHHLLEWLIKQRKIDEDDLIRLHKIGSEDYEECTGRDVMLGR